MNDPMNALKYLLAVCAAVTVYCALSLSYGPMGQSAYHERLAVRDMQLENIKKLRALNAELKNYNDSLEYYDRDTIAVIARQLGYGYKDERYIRVLEFEGTPPPSISAGDIVTASEPFFVADRTIKLCALFTGILIFCLLFTLEKLRR